VHFHIIPKLGDAGLGIEWRAGSHDGARGRELAGRIASLVAGA
jgi:diadenosine tetraphosphate (Ap4A) HIT family hydrolase